MSSKNQEKKALRVVIVDDEKLARQALLAELEDHPQVEVAACCANGFEAVKVIGETAPDLVFLDIQMPKLDGFEVLELLDDPPPVIFVTAYDEYALKAFEVHAVDYLLKPIDPDRLSQALKRVMERRAASQGGPGAAQEGQGAPGAADKSDAGAAGDSAAAGSAAGGGLGKGGSGQDSAGGGQAVDLEALAAAARPQPLERILVKDGGDISVIAVDSIDYIEAQDDYVNIVAEGRGHLKQQRMAHYEETLPSERFVRVHRSYILNLDRLSKLELYAKDSRIAILSDGSKVPVSRSGYSRLKEYLER
ncbi:MAG TPA: response regulator [Acidobacteriota bacterium]|nr:response regulator [Acidobacteriota bacterium]